MKIAYRDEKHIVANLERGEELFSQLLAYMQAENTPSATLAGLGAADRLELAYYHLESKTYERHIIEEEVEILSLTGNFSFLDNQPVLHVHGVFGKRDLSTFGGHVFSCRISGAGEIHLATLPAEMSRAFDKSTGLNLLCDQAENF